MSLAAASFADGGGQRERQRPGAGHRDEAAARAGVGRPGQRPGGVEPGGVDQAGGAPAAHGVAPRSMPRDASAARVSSADAPAFDGLAGGPVAHDAAHPPGVARVHRDHARPLCPGRRREVGDLAVVGLDRDVLQPDRRAGEAVGVGDGVREVERRRRAAGRRPAPRAAHVDGLLLEGDRHELREVAVEDAGGIRRLVQRLLRLLQAQGERQHPVVLRRRGRRARDAGQHADGHPARDGSGHAGRRAPQQRASSDGVRHARPRLRLDALAAKPSEPEAAPPLAKGGEPACRRSRCGPDGRPDPPAPTDRPSRPSDWGWADRGMGRRRTARARPPVPVRSGGCAAVLPAAPPPPWVPAPAGAALVPSAPPAGRRPPSV